MPLERPFLEAQLARLNADRKEHERVRLESFEPGRFVLSFPERQMPEGQCLDQDFTEIQWLLHDTGKVFTNIVGGRKDEDAGRFHIEYEALEWD